MDFARVLLDSGQGAGDDLRVGPGTRSLRVHWPSGADLSGGLPRAA